MFRADKEPYELRRGHYRCTRKVSLPMAVVIACGDASEPVPDVRDAEGYR